VKIDEITPGELKHAKAFLEHALQSYDKSNDVIVVEFF